MINLHQMLDFSPKFYKRPGLTVTFKSEQIIGIGLGFFERESFFSSNSICLRRSKFVNILLQGKQNLGSFILKLLCSLSKFGNSSQSTPMKIYQNFLHQSACRKSKDLCFMIYMTQVSAERSIWRSSTENPKQNLGNSDHRGLILNNDLQAEQFNY